MRVNKIIIVLSLAFTSSLLLSSGCGMMEKVFIDDLMPKRVVKNKQQAVKKEQGKIEQEKIEQGKIEPEKIESKDQENKPTGELNLTSQGNKANEVINITIFLADEEYFKLVPVHRKISKVEGLAKAAINELIKGPGKNEKYYSVIPKGAKLLGIVIKDGICYIDFSKELKNNHSGGSTGESLTVNSIVKTLCQFSTIEKVQILIEGKVIESLAGHVDISQPLNPNYIEK